MRTISLVAFGVLAACGARSGEGQSGRTPIPIGESRPPNDAAIATACRALCAMHPDYAGASRPMPPFSLKTTDGRLLTMDQLRGKVVLLNVWSSIASAAVAPEMPELSKLAQILGARTDVVLVTLAAEDYPEHAEDLLKATLGNRPRYLVLIDQDGKVAAQLGTRKYPETWLVDPNGVLRARFDGRRAWSDPKVIAMLDATKSGPECPVEIDGGYISGAGDAACEAAAAGK
jgi:peroxiredoxin